jgi:hypothetical protein
MGVKGVYMKNKQWVWGIALMVMATISTFAQQYDAESDFIVSRSENGRSVIITGYSGTNQIVRIPPQIRGLPVTHIGERAFESKQLTSVTIPNSVTTIGDFAFHSNQLTSVTIPNSVTRIGDWAFPDNRLTSVTIPDSVTYIGEHAFTSETYGNQLTSLTIGNSVTTIGRAAFFNNQLISVTIPNSVREIGQSAFRSETLTRITIGRNVILAKDSWDDKDFEGFYNQAGKRAGTYVYSNGRWGEEW